MYMQMYTINVYIKIVNLMNEICLKIYIKEKENYNLIKILDYIFIIGVF